MRGGGGGAGAFVPAPGSLRTVGMSSDGAWPGAGGGPRRRREVLGLLGMCGFVRGQAWGRGLPKPAARGHPGGL